MVVTLKKIRADSPSQLSQEYLHKNYHWNLSRVFDLCSEIPSDSKWCFRFVMYEFSGLGRTIESRLTGTVFKILDTRQSEILIEFSRNIPFNSPKNSRSLLRNLQRFQTLSWLQSWRNCRAWAYYKISMVSALRNSIVLTRESRLTGTVFKILDTRQSLEICKQRLTILRRIKRDISWKFDKNFRLPGI